MATESSNVTKERTVCKCGHHISQHRMETEDKQCSVCSCWDFPNMQIRERVREGESAKQKTSNSQPLTSVQKKSKSKPRQLKQSSKSKKNDNGDDEKRFIPYFEAAIHSIDRLTSDFHEKKKRIVEKLAVTLKSKGFRVSGIANEIVHQLKGRASRSWILEILDNEYKDKTYQENARNRRKAASPTNEDSLTEQQTASSYKDEVAMTTVAPLAEQSQQMIVGVDGHEVEVPNPISGQGLAGGQMRVGNPDPVNPSSELVKKEVKKSPSQYSLRVLIDWDELSDKMAELHHKDIKNFWLCGQIDENGKLIDMVLEQQKADDMMVPELMEVEKVTA